jgi:hypothetical protein
MALGVLYIVTKSVTDVESYIVHREPLWLSLLDLVTMALGVLYKIQHQ